MSNKKIKWGIISTGWIASCFAKALNGVKDAEIVAVASRNIDKANEFADKYKIAKRYSSYEELAKDSDIDIVYIATPHSHHKANAILCLNNSKNILVEKAFTLNAKEAKEVIELARSKNLFVMEAMWTRFFPASKKVKELLQNKTIGDIHYVNGDLSFNAFMDGRADMDGRLFNPDLAGGALLDVGIYPISYASFVFGAQPVAFESTVHKTTTGVDERFNLFFKYENGATAFLTGSFQSIAPREVTIVGSLGYIRIPDFFCPKQVILKVKTEAEQVFNFPWPEDYPASYDQNGLFYEAEAVTKYILDGKKESDVISPDETIKLMETLDSIRAKWGIKYPGEN